MLLDCSTCPGRGSACDGCVVGVLLDPRPAMSPDMARAIDVLQDAGLIGPVHLALVDPPAPQSARGFGRPHAIGRRAG